MRFRKKIVSTIGIMGFTILIIYMGVSIVLFNIQIDERINSLFAISGNVSDKKFNFDKIDNLPEPVQRYFKSSLENGQNYVSYAKLKHTGEFRQNEKQGWMPIEGEEYFTASKPGFIWIGKIKPFPFPFIWITGIDEYVNGKGNFQIKLMSIFTIADAPKGKELNESELLRWLGEAPLFPTALLPNNFLEWEEVNSYSAKATIKHAGSTVEVIFHFNENGQIVQMVGDRYRSVNNTYEKQEWNGYYGNYTKIQNMSVPLKIEVAWNTNSGNFSYAKFNITDIQYDNPLKY